MRLLLLSAYDAQSHRYWREVLENGIRDWQWTVLTLPPRHFAWRVRGNPMAWHSNEAAALAAPYDLVLATSMVDLATLRGLVPSLAATPCALYFHENQFAYPEGDTAHGLLDAQLSSIYAALAADALVFNSAYNRDSFLAGCGELMRRLPDGTPADLPATLRAKSSVLPVPIDLAATSAVEVQAGPLQLVWNHRWEYDKGPEELLELAQAVTTAGLEVTVHVVGQQFRRRPPVFDELKDLLEQSGCLGRWGTIEDREQYLALLGRCDVVLSTALHDFQGLSVLEACTLGCTPLVPDRLVYPDWVEEECRYADVGDALAILKAWCRRKRGGQRLPTQDVSAFAASALLPRYRALLAGIAA